MIMMIQGTKTECYAYSNVAAAHDIFGFTASVRSFRSSLIDSSVHRLRLGTPATLATMSHPGSVDVAIPVTGERKKTTREDNVSGNVFDES